LIRYVLIVVVAVAFALRLKIINWYEPDLMLKVR